MGHVDSGHRVREAAVGEPGRVVWELISKTLAGDADGLADGVPLREQFIKTTIRKKARSAGVLAVNS